MGADIPFSMMEGSGQLVATYNRKAAIERIEYLCGTNLAKQDDEFKKLVDIRMFELWYKDAPKDKKIDEDFCQKVSAIVRELQMLPGDVLLTMKSGSPEVVKKLFAEHCNTPSFEQPVKTLEDSKPNIWGKAISLFAKFGKSEKN